MITDKLNRKKIVNTKQINIASLPGARYEDFPSRCLTALACVWRGPVVNLNYYLLIRSTYTLTHEDVNLGYFEYVQHRLKSIVSGDLLTKVAEGYANANGDLVLKFSKKFSERINAQLKKGFQLKEVKTGFIVYWKKEDAEQEIKIILPELYFEKQ